MKRLLVTCVLSGLVLAGPSHATEPELKSEDDKTLYALGLVISKQLAAFRLSPAELEIVKAGLSDGTANKGKVDLEAYGPKIQPLAQQRLAAAAGEEKKKGQAYLAKVAETAGVTKSESGLLMQTITEGTGASPGPTDKVKVNYKGTLIDGTVFDSSEKRGGPASLSLTQVVKCWTEGLQKMKTGGKAKLYCPSDIGFGDRGQGADIPPGATLVFEVELLEIEKPATP